MSELDILEELRLLAEIADNSEVGLVMLSGRSFTDAAKEIDYLRQEVSAFKAEMQWLRVRND